MTEEIRKPELEKGSFYTIEMYPSDSLVETKYLGQSGNIHVFKGEMVSGFILVDDDCIYEEKMTITPRPGSLVGFRWLTKPIDKIEPVEERSRLAKILTDVGAQL